MNQIPVCKHFNFLLCYKNYYFRKVDLETDLKKKELN